MHPIAADLRYALRQFRKAPAFSLTILIVMALGVGATTAIFTLFDQVLLRNLPVPHAEELVRFQRTGSFSGRASSRGGEFAEYFSYPAYKYLRDHNAVFSAVIASDGPLQVGVGWHGVTDLLQSELVSGNYFDALGVHPAVGRLFASSDDVAKNGNPVAVLSYDTWAHRFGADASVIGKPLMVNGHLFTVVGVTPPGFYSVLAGNAPDLFFPMTMKPIITPDWDDLENHRSVWLNMLARLKPGVSREQAQAAMQAVWHALRSDEVQYEKNTPENHRKNFLNSKLVLLPGATGFSPMRDTLSTPLRVLMGMAALMLLMACANVASLLLVRAAGRAREISVRYALGAKRKQIVRQLLTEGLCLGLTGGALGVVLARPTASLLISRMQGQPGAVSYSASPDPRLLLFSFVLTLVASLLFSLAPALQFWRPSLAPILRQGSAMVSGGFLQLRRTSVAVQLVLSVLLLSASGLFARTLLNLRSVQVGFAPDHLVSFAVDPRLAGYQSEQVHSLDQHILQILRGLPGVHAAGATDDPELTGDQQMSGVEIAGFKPQESQEMNVEISSVDAGYFSTLRVLLLAGRSIKESDTVGRQLVAVVSENFAKHFFSSANNALGRSFHMDTKDYVIVGVVGNTRHESLRKTEPRRVFLSYLQQPVAGLSFYVRTTQAPGTVVNTIRSAMQQLDPKLALDSLQTMDMQMDLSLQQESTIALLASSFGLLAATMAAIGLYGVLAYATAQRTREIGVRMALGANRVSVALLVMSEVLKLAGLSIVLALPLAYLFGRTAKSLLYGVGSADPLTLLSVVALVTLVAAFAALLPARRAAMLEPMKALRYE